jgi:hypothetical protein
MKKYFLLIILLLTFISPQFVFADKFDFTGPKGKQYIGDGGIEFSWYPSSEFHTIWIEDSEENGIWTVHAEKVRSDEPITSGEYNLNDHYPDWRIEDYLKDGEEYRFVLTNVNGADYYSDWFVAYHGKSETDVVYDNLSVSAKPGNLNEGDELIIDFSNIGADYYIVSAVCKDSVVVSGKARPDLCVEGEKVYPQDKYKDLRVDDFYPSAQRDTSFQIVVTAYDNGKEIDYATDAVEIKVDDKDTDDKGDDEKEICNMKDDDSDGITDEGCDDDYDHYADNNLTCDGEFWSLEYNGDTQFEDQWHYGWWYYGNGWRGKSYPCSTNSGDIDDTNPNIKQSSSKPDLSKNEILNLMKGLFGENSDAYKIVSLLIDLGIIELN